MISRRQALEGLAALSLALGADPVRRRAAAAPAPHRTPAPTPLALSGDLAGGLARHGLRPGDTLPEIAVEYGLGYTELLAANPGADAWLPGDDRSILLPTAYVLPGGPREGIVINLAEQRLYYFPAPGTVITTPIGIGREAFGTPLGETRIVRKAEDPVWVPPPSVRAERPDLPRAVGPGPANPLGAFALYLGWPRYLLHGTNRPYGIGRRVSHGCLRLYPEHIAWLYATVPIGTRVRVIDETVKLGWAGNALYAEVHPSQAEADALEETGTLPHRPIPELATRIADAAGARLSEVDWETARRAAAERRGIPLPLIRPAEG